MIRCKLLFFLLFSITAYSQNAWDYIGIPYVTDEVPDEIMPTLPNNPTGNGNSWPTYDPATVANPTFSDGASQYYIDLVSGDDGTAGNSGRGSVANPRLTIPGLSGATWTLSAGDQLFFAGGGTAFSSGTDYTLVASGTAANPVWILTASGETAPNFNHERLDIGGTHVIFDGIKWQPTNGKVTVSFGFTSNPLQYGCIRNSDFIGLGTASSGRNKTIGTVGLLAERTDFILFYNNTIRDFGQWNRADANGVDRHGIQPIGYVSHFWIIDNSIYHMEGDSIQLNTSNQNDALYAARPHYTYIAGNELYENYEQAIDHKNSYHTISSENTIHDIYNDYKQANSVSYLVNNDEGWLSGYEWVLFNTIYDVTTGIKFASTASETVDDPNGSPPVQTAGQKSYAIGNSVIATDKGFQFDKESAEPSGIMTLTYTEERWVINNSFSSGGRGLNQQTTSQSGIATWTSQVIGNIFESDEPTEAEIDLLNGTGQTFNFNYNVVYNPGDTVDITSGSLDSNVGNSLDTDPLYTSASDLAITTGSPAIDLLAAKPAPYALFETLYGINIEYDILGNARPASGADWDAGAYEYEAGAGAATLTRSSSSGTGLLQ